MNQTVQNLSHPTTVLTLGAVGVVTILGIRWYQKRKKSSIPTEWEPVGTIKSLYIYPLKSGSKLELKTALCTEIGIRACEKNSVHQFYDRSLVVYTENDNEFRTSRTYPKLLFIEASACDQDHFTLTAPGMSSIKVKIPDVEGNPRISEIKWWNDEKVSAVDCGDEAAKWMSHYIFEKDYGLRLGFYDVRKRRDISKSHANHFPAFPFLRNEATGTFTDLSSYHIINQASVDELNSRLPEHNITVHNFRPNIVIEGKNATAYAEDNWQWIKIGNVILYVAKPCTRCSVVTLNPDTGVRLEKHDPLTTLKKYRQLKDLKNIDVNGTLPVMGSNIGLLKGGEISVGDIVYVGKE